MSTERPLSPAPLPPGQGAGFALPAGACDSHVHVFGPYARFPMGAGRGYDAPEAPLAALKAHLAALGLSRVVIVQPSIYGTDNRATMHAVGALGDAARAVVVVAPDIAEADLHALDAAGACGARVNPIFGGSAGLESLPVLAGRLADLGWHLQLLMDVTAVGDLAALLGTLPVPVVFDHMGHCPAQAALQSDGFRALLGLLETGRAWVKLSGAYRVSAPPYGDAALMARALIAANPERVIWGSDWPHPMCPVPMPADADLLDMLADWAPDAETRARILSENPAALYGFQAS